MLKQNKSEHKWNEGEILYITAENLNLRKYHKTQMTGHVGRERKELENVCIYYSFSF